MVQNQSVSAVDVFVFIFLVFIAVLVVKVVHRWNEDRILIRDYKRWVDAGMPNDPKYEEPRDEWI